MNIKDEEFKRAIETELGSKMILDRLLKSRIDYKRLMELLKLTNSLGSTLGIVIARYPDVTTIQKFLRLLEQCPRDIIEQVLQQESKEGYSFGALISIYQDATTIQQFLSLIEQCIHDKRLTAEEVYSLSRQYKQLDMITYCKDRKNTNLVQPLMSLVFALKFKDEVNELIIKLNKYNYAANIIPEKVREIEQKMKLMLFDYNDYLIHKRSSTKDNTSKYDALIAQIQERLNHPLAQPLKDNNHDGDPMFDCYKLYQETYTKVQDYKLRIREGLDAIKNKIYITTQKKEWVKKGFFFGWSTSASKPSTVDAILSLLEQLKPDNSNVLDIYENVLNKLLTREDHEGRHPDTRNFYSAIQTQLQLITFTSNLTLVPTSQAAPSPAQPAVATPPPSFCSIPQNYTYSQGSAAQFPNLTALLTTNAPALSSTPMVSATAAAAANPPPSFVDWRLYTSGFNLQKDEQAMPIAQPTALLQNTAGVQVSTSRQTLFSPANTVADHSQAPASAPPRIFPKVPTHIPNSGNSKSSRVAMSG